MPKKTYLTMSEVTRKLKISRQAVLGALKTGRLKGKLTTVKIPTKTWLISTESVNEFKVSRSHQERGQKNT